MIKVIDGGVNAAKGYTVASVRAGIKASSTKKDMALIKSEVPAVAVGTFTKNLVKAAPVQWDSNIVYNVKKAQAVIVNTGIANAATGAEGLKNCETEAAKVSELLPKEIAVEFEAGGKTCTIGAMCKGSGMIHPNMGTMLGYIMTDTAVDYDIALKTLREVIDVTFNMVSVDGDTSTNDTVLLLANGLAENEVIADEGKDLETFKAALTAVCEFLAKNIAKDGEGATRLFTAHVTGAPDYETAKVLAKSIITSNLSKAAIFGTDANCGRIFCAMGYSGAEFDPMKTDITMSSKNGSIKLIENGMFLTFSEEEALNILQPDEITAECDIKSGDFEATAWGCDLTYDYVKINADYRS